MNIEEEVIFLRRSVLLMQQNMTSMQLIMQNQLMMIAELKCLVLVKEKSCRCYRTEQSAPGCSHCSQSVK